MPRSRHRPPTPHQVVLNWALPLKWVFGIEIESCARYSAEWSLSARAPPSPAGLL